MKFNFNILLNAALVSTLSVMVACAPAKRGAKFADRTGANSGGTEVDRFFGKTRVSSAEELAFDDAILLVDASIEDSNGTKLGRQKLSELEAERVKNQTSALPRLKNEDTENESDEAGEAVGLASSQSVKAKNKALKTRDEHLITVRVGIAGVGAIDFMGYNTDVGTEAALARLSNVDGDCAKKISYIEVRAACVDVACSKLAIQIADVRNEENEIVSNKILIQSGVTAKKPVSTISFKKFVKETESVDGETIDPVVMKSSEIEMAVCKDEKEKDKEKDSKKSVSDETATDEAAAATDDKKDKNADEETAADIVGKL